MSTPPRPSHSFPARNVNPAGVTPGSGSELLYTPAEAAQLLKIRESWLRRKAAARQVPCTFLGKHLRFSTADLTAIVAAAARPAGARKPRRRSTPTVRDTDLPAPPQRSVHAQGNDHRSQGSSSCPG